MLLLLLCQDCCWISLPVLDVSFLVQCVEKNAKKNVAVAELMSIQKETTVTMTMMTITMVMAAIAIFQVAIAIVAIVTLTEEEEEKKKKIR